MVKKENTSADSVEQSEATSTQATAADAGAAAADTSAEKPTQKAPRRSRAAGGAAKKSAPRSGRAASEAEPAAESEPVAEAEAPAEAAPAAPARGRAPRSARAAAEPEAPAESESAAAEQAAAEEAAEEAVVEELAIVVAEELAIEEAGVLAEATEIVEAAEAAEAVAESAPVVSILPEPFISAPSTALIFLAPDLPPLPPRSRHEEHEAEDEDDFGGNRRRSRRRGDDRREPQRPENSREERGLRENQRDNRNTREDRNDRNSRDDRNERDDRGARDSEQPRSGRAPREVALITEPQKIKGSTRLEAKKQRRRDGRDAGRRRPVVTEAEFLARRESVDRTMVVREKNQKIQIGVLEDSVLVEHYVARNEEASLIGNVYLGRVQNVLPSMEAAFVDIGRGRNAVLYSGEVDWEAAGTTGNQPRRIELALKPGDKILVQVTKDPVGHKGARLTSQVSLPGRYLVYVPNGSMSGISRKLPDTERARLKKILKEVLPENTGVIVRTAAEGATEEQLTLDVNRLTGQWTYISEQLKKANAPALLHSEPDLLVKIVRDVFNEDFQKMVIAGDDARVTIASYLEQVAPDLVDRVERYEGSKDVFDEYRITEQIEKALDRKVWLPSGGSLVIDRTEAMTVIDVNTGKFVGSGGNLEETVTKNNLEAAEEIVRQMRLRDIGGIIVVDFIDMVLESNRDLVLRRVIECLSRDRTKHQVAEVTSLGLVQMTRKKLGLGLLESFSEPCETCAGRGVIVHHDPVVKHKQTPQPERRRSGKQNSGAQNSGAQNGSGAAQGNQAAPAAAPKVSAAHAITDDAKNALAQIAASTLPVTHEDTAEAEHAGSGTPEGRKKRRRGGKNRDAGSTGTEGAAESAAEESVESAAEEAPAASERVSGSRRARSGGNDWSAPAPDVIVIPVAEAPAEAPEAESAEADAAAERPARGNSRPARGGRSGRRGTPDNQPLLDIPLEAVRKNHKVDVKVAEDLLGSVLNALPEPKQPGKGRNRNRRVSTAALTGTPVQHDQSEGTE